jgi:hypothetical protein
MVRLVANRRLKLNRRVLKLDHSSGDINHKRWGRCSTLPYYYPCACAYIGSIYHPLKRW